MIFFSRENWIFSVEAGDIVLFSRSCASMDVISGCICVAAKIGSLSEWDHVGIVVENPDGELCILEANLSGMSCHRLEDRLRRTRSKIAIRSLSGPKSKEFKDLLWSIAMENMEKSYNSSMFQFVRAWYHGLASHGVNKKLLRLLAMKHELSLLHIEQKHHADAPLTSSLIQSRIDTLSTAIFTQDITIHPLPPQATKECYFCSELVTSIYHRLGVLDRIREGNTYVPSEYSSTVRTKGLFFTNGYQLSPNIPIMSKDCKLSSEKGYLFIHQPYNSKAPLQLEFSSGDKLFVSSYHIPPHQFIHVNNGQLKILHQSNNYDTCYGNHITASNRDTVARVVMHLESLDVTKLAEMKRCESFDSVALHQNSVPNIWRMLHNDALILQSDERALLTIGQHEQTDVTSRQRSAFHVDTKSVDSYYLHERSVDLLLQLLHPNETVPDSIRKTFLLGSEIIHGTRASLLRDKDMLYFVLRGEVQSCGANRQYGVRARQGDIVNTECLVGADIRNDWRAVDDDVPVVLGVDRWVLSATGVALSSWLWSTIIGQAQDKSLARIAAKFTPATSPKVSPMLDDITIDNAITALHDVTRKETKDEVTNALVSEHLQQLLKQDYVAKLCVVPLLTASASIQEKVEKIVRESEEGGSYGVNKPKKIVATSYHPQMPHVSSRFSSFQLPPFEKSVDESPVNVLCTAAVIRVGLRCMRAWK